MNYDEKLEATEQALLVLTDAVEQVEIELSNSTMIRHIGKPFFTVIIKVLEKRLADVRAKMR